MDVCVCLHSFSTSNFLLCGTILFTDHSVQYKKTNNYTLLEGLLHLFIKITASNGTQTPAANIMEISQYLAENTVIGRSYNFLYIIEMKFSEKYLHQKRFNREQFITSTQREILFSIHVNYCC